MRTILAFAAGMLVGSACMCACSERKRRHGGHGPRSYDPVHSPVDGRRETGQEWGPATPPETPAGGPEMTGEPRPTGLSPHEPPIKAASADDAPPLKGTPSDGSPKKS